MTNDAVYSRIVFNKTANRREALEKLVKDGAVNRFFLAALAKTSRWQEKFSEQKPEEATLARITV
jgi:hypothetical protein